MTIKVGDAIPSVTLMYMTDNGPSRVTTDEIFGGRRVVLFAVPGAFTPTCSASHLPGFVANADTILGKGVDTIACISVNDAFVMDAWGKDQNAGGKVMMLADGNGDFAKAMGVDEDRTDKGMGIRSRRYAMVVEDGVVKTLNIEAPGKFEISDADTILAAL
jgi:peroxiredoxin